MASRTSQPPSNLNLKSFRSSGDGKFKARKISSVAEEVFNPTLKAPREPLRVTVRQTSAESSRLRSTPSKAFAIGQTVIGRTSLLGRPVSTRSHRRDVRYRRFQAKTYNFLERPKDWQALSYHLIVFLMVFKCLLLSVFSTVDQYEEVAGIFLYYLEVVMLVWFSGEFMMRVWSAGCRSRYQQWSGRLQFIRRPLCIVDMVVIGASVVILFLGSGGKVFATSALRGLRFFQILRMVRVDRRGGSWKLLGSVVWAHRQELFTTLYIGFLGLIFTSFVMYLAEKEKNPKKFGTYADALWWGVITLCTVGYGDSVPITGAGKLIASVCSILGISFFALPAGILGSGFALKVQQQQRQKHLIRRKGPAAVLIQSLWRCYAADEDSTSIATWKIHLKPCSFSHKTKTNTSFMSRLSTRRKDTTGGLAGGVVAGGVGGAMQHLNLSCSITGLHSPMLLSRSFLCRSNNAMAEADKEEDYCYNDRSRLSLSDFHHYQNSNNIHRRSDYKENENEDQDDSEGVTQLTEVHKRAIRSLRKISYFVARRKFKEAFRPYDVKDVIEQYSAGSLDMLTRIKSLQCRLDLILGKSGSKKVTVYESKVTLASRIVKVERQVEEIETKLDLLIDMFKIESCKTKSLLTHEIEQTTSQPVEKNPQPEIEHEDDHHQDDLIANTILIDNKFQSEPSVTSHGTPQSKLVQRNLSDLGPRRMRKVKPYSKRSLNNHFPHLNDEVKEELETSETSDLVNKIITDPRLDVISGAVCAPTLAAVDQDASAATTPKDSAESYGHPQLKRLSANYSSAKPTSRQFF